MTRIAASLATVGLAVQATVAPAVAAEGALKAHEYRLSIQDKAAIFRGSIPVSDKRFLDLLDTAGVAPKLSVEARRTVLTTDLVHYSAAAVGALSLLGAAFLIPNGNYYLGRSGSVTMTAADGTQLTGSEPTLRSLGQDMITGGWVLAALCVASQTAWFYHPRPFDLDAAQDAIDEYNSKLLASKQKLKP